MKNRKSIAKRFNIKVSRAGKKFEHDRSNTNHNFRKKEKREMRALKISNTLKKSEFKYRKLIYK